jgi:uncharacterized membrane protein YidH (DUF202 family)
VTPRRIVGLILILLGVVVLLTGGVFWKQQEKILDTGPLEVTRERHGGVSIPPVLSGVCILAGIVLLVLPARTRS